MKQTTKRKRTTTKHQYTLTELKQKGWSSLMIKKLLPQPDLEFYDKPSKKYIKAWSVYIINSVEKTPEYKKMNKEFKKWKADKKVVNKETQQKILAEFNTLTMLNDDVLSQSFVSVTQAAIKSYNTWGRKQIGLDFKPASLDSDLIFLHRITVNYLLHHGTIYTQEWVNKNFSTNHAAYYCKFKDKTLEEIGEKWRVLRQEVKLARKKNDAEEAIAKGRYR